MEKGKFIVLEGPEGCGKSTIALHLKKDLIQAGNDVVLTREPGGSATAELLRGVILDPSIDLDPVEQMLLLNAGRRNHIRNTIMPALQRGAIVLCDRFVASTLTLQTLQKTEHPVDDELVLQLHKLASFNMAPDLMLHFAASSEIRCHRRSIRNGAMDRFENGDLEYDNAVAQKYFASADILGHKMININAENDIDSVTSECLSALRSEFLDIK